MGQKIQKRKISKTPNKIKSQKNKRFLTRQHLGLVLIVLGCSLLIGLGVYRAVYGQDVSFAVDEVSLAVEEVEEGVLPKQIVIESIGIDLSIFEGEIVKGKWVVASNGVNHWNQSAKLGEKGNVVIYGHNWRSLLGPIRGLELGDTIAVTGENQQIYKYTITQTLIVKPTQVEIVLPTEDERLTLYTCTGWLDRERFVVIARPTI